MVLEDSFWKWWQTYCVYTCEIICEMSIGEKCVVCCMVMRHDPHRDARQYFPTGRGDSLIVSFIRMPSSTYSKKWTWTFDEIDLQKTKLPFFSLLCLLDTFISQVPWPKWNITSNVSEVHLLWRWRPWPCPPCWWLQRPPWPRMACLLWSSGFPISLL